MASQYIPIDLESIEQGQFMEAFAQALSKFSHDIVKYVAQAEADGDTGKIVGKVSADIVIEYKDKGFLISTGVATKMPSKVRHGASRAFEENDPKDGKPCLFAKTAGTDRTHPKQATFCNEDGSTPTKE